MANLRRRKIDILGISIDSFTKEEALRYIGKKISAKNPLFLTTVNTEFANKALESSEVATMLGKTSLNLADGVGILWAARFLRTRLPKQKFWRYIFSFLKFFGSLATIIIYPKYIRTPIPERISGSDFIWELSRFAARNNLSVFLLGGDPTVPEQAALKLQTDIYDLRMAGTYEGTPKIEDEDKIIRIIKKAGPDILFVAYGVPAEELWLGRNLKKTGAKIGIGVGGTFGFLAGRKPRAPKFIRSIGLEWLYRLIIEPRRFHRQLALPKFAWRVFRYKIRTNND